MKTEMARSTRTKVSLAEMCLRGEVEEVGMKSGHIFYSEMGICKLIWKVSSPRDTAKAKEGDSSHSAKSADRFGMTLWFF
jgi:hypothetical protein